MPCAGFRANLLSSKRTSGRTPTRSTSTDWFWTGTSLALATQGRDPQLSSGDFPLRLKESLKPYSTHILPGHAIPSG